MSHAEPHDHHDGHDHAPVCDADETDRYERVLEAALRELLEERGLVTAEDIHRQIDLQDSRTPALGAEVVARAWTDPAFRRQLLEEPLGAIRRTFGVELATPLKLVVLENTPVLHNVVVCTLCSCYPRMLLGVPPAWYKSVDYRSRVVSEPRKVLAEFGTTVPNHVEVRVSDSTADVRYLVLPLRPANSEALTAVELAALVTRDSMIGTAIPRYNP